MEIPIEQQNLVLNRVKSAKQNPARLIDWDEASQKLKG